MNSSFLVAAAAAVLASVGNVGIGAQDLGVQQPRPLDLRVQELTAREDAQVAGVFSPWLSSDAPECVPVSVIGSAAHLTRLTPEQFQFVRALYIAIPPVSRQLPPGDSAVVANAGGQAMIALVAGD